MLYEFILLFAVAFIATWLFQFAAGTLQIDGWRRHLLQGFILGVFAIYFVFCWLRGGQTLAMKTWRIRVVDRHGRPLTQGRALLRYVFCSIWFAAPLAAYSSGRFSLPGLAVVAAGWVAIWALLSRFHPQRQFWHDAWAGTRLVDAQER